MRLIKFYTIISLLFAVGCKVKQQPDYRQLYQEAIVKYEEKDYYHALKLFKEVMPLLKGKKELVNAQFCQAYAYFHQKSYRYSGHFFKEFYENYPRLQQAEEALYMAAYSYYVDKPDVRLDQDKTEKAYDMFHAYINRYPGGKYMVEAQQCSKDLYHNYLARKAYKNAKLYIHLGYRQAAVVALDNFQRDYPGDKRQEKASYLKAKVQYQLAKETKLDQEQLPHFRKFVSYYYDFIDDYPQSSYREKIAKLYTAAIQEINHLISNS